MPTLIGQAIQESLEESGIDEIEAVRRQIARNQAQKRLRELLVPETD